MPPADRPPVAVVRNSFNLMVGIGTALAALSAFYLILWWRKGRLPRSRWFYRAVVAAGPLSLVALIAGWITTEVGRQPWIVYQVMRVERGRDGCHLGADRLRDDRRRLRRPRGDGRLAAAPAGTEPDRVGAPAHGGRLLMAPELCAAVLVIGVVAYAVFGGADFGAGFWDLTAGGAERGARVRGLVKRSMGPVWEANHVWLIFVLVVFWTAFPEAFGAVMSTLYVPLFFASIGIIFRGAAFAIRGEAATIAEARFLGAMFALSSVLTPFFLGVTVGAIASGQVPAPPGGGEPISSWTNLTSIYTGVLAVGVGAYLGAVFLAADAVRSDLPDLAEAFRKRALGAAVVVGALAIGGIVELHEDAPQLYDGLTSGVGLAAVIGSIVAGGATFVLLMQRRLFAARFTSAVTVAAVIVGLALAMRPDLLPGVLTLDEAAASNATLVPLLGGVVLAIVILAPSLTWLYRLTLRGTLDTEFHPIGAADHPETKART